ncbi:aldose epimerase family protein [Phyllobacterium endophyticum]|uniref:Aldose 1-epimerase n=1 Tax=Phyllobacterium endophyticum TaxID=1149773 RepID=A0A2P7ANQ9_9HYPH|nr:aldose epimerase family protein [Phyllobacterium endophyticum]MBB3233817.1 aldose 1-epimerase [Phyllobacterium endophyticum]PSH55853.1 galactose-1-epimerase [Phyllobacterium endophyticum]TYR40990.1 galactose mutarotase [Phyllobacterium endophyticum]
MRDDANPEPFGTFHGEPVFQVTIRSPAGAVARILNWGAVIRDLQIPLTDGALQRVVLGFDEFGDYPARSPYFGALVGRYANRIAAGRFQLDGKTVQLDLNEHGIQTLHGGSGGVSQRLWTIAALTRSSVTLAMNLPDGDQGFPGSMDVQCTYSLVDDLTLRVEVEAVTDAPTVANFAQHSYFNLDGSSDIRNHKLRILADAYTPVDGNLIPTGEIAAVGETAYDFRLPRRIGTSGSTLYDHNFVLSEPISDGMRFAASLVAGNGLAMQVHTSEPGLQFYDGAKIAAVTGHGGTQYGPHAGLCLEAQHFPDSPNQPQFPGTALRPGETYRQRTEFRFHNV